jgi:multiple antibiotic resistance protein
MDFVHLPEAVRNFAEAAISVFAIVNPIGALPILIGLTDGFPPWERKRVLRLAGLMALTIICVMAMVGQYLLEGVFHISLSEFMFGGGLILMVVGIRRILEAHDDEGEKKPMTPEERAKQGVSMAVSPIASPLLVGPGSIVTVMLLVSKHGVLYGLAACLAAFVFVLLLLNYVDFAIRLMGRLGALAVGRIMEIFIVAIGAHFVFSAVKQVFPGLTGP